jgi:hypothetical protein
MSERDIERHSRALDILGMASYSMLVSHARVGVRSSLRDPPASVSAMPAHERPSDR